MTAGFEGVSLRDVSRHFGRRRAVSRISLSFEPGEIIGLLGPNGAGKSTLIGMLATLVAPSAGRIQYGSLGASAGTRARADAAGPSIGAGATADGSAIRRRIGFLGHELHLYAELSARQNLEFFARLYGLDPGPIVGPALERAGLADRDLEPVAGFSRGMRQRLAFERAVMHEPGLLLLDEPFTGLDDRAVQLTSERVRGVARAGAIVCLATHDLDLADGLVTRLVAVRNGAVVADEAARPGLRERYQSLMR